MALLLALFPVRVSCSVKKDAREHLHLLEMAGGHASQAAPACR